MSCVNRTVRPECHESGSRQGIFRYCRNGDNIFSHASALFSRLFYYLCGIDPSRCIRVHHKHYTGSCCSSFFVFCSTANIRFLQRLPLSFTFYPTELRMNHLLQSGCLLIVIQLSIICQTIVSFLSIALRLVLHVV